MTSRIDSQISNLLFEARTIAGMSQAELASAMGTQQPSIARVENGMVSPTITFLKRVADALGTKLILPSFDSVKQRHLETSLKIISTDNLVLTSRASYNYSPTPTTILTA